MARNSKIKLIISAAPQTEDQNDQIQVAINKAFPTNSEGDNSSNWFWIGFTDSQFEGNFININTGGNITLAGKPAPFVYTNWAKKQPDNWEKKEFANGQDVVAISRKTGQWDDSFDHFEKPFVCWSPPKGKNSSNFIYLPGSRELRGLILWLRDAKCNL